MFKITQYVTEYATELRFKILKTYIYIPQNAKEVRAFKFFLNEIINLYIHHRKI